MDPQARIEAYFNACSHASADEIAAHFTKSAVIWDTNVAPFRGAQRIGKQWVRVRERWLGAVWGVDSYVVAADGETAAIEWWMTGTDPATEGTFTFRGSEHYRFVDTLIDEIRQYWNFDSGRLDSGLVEFPYPTSAEESA